MSALIGVHRCAGAQTVGQAVVIAACALALAACASTTTSYQAEAMQASDAGDQKKAITLAKKEVARFLTPDQCSRTQSFNCGTLALAYGTLAGYQILDGDRTGGEQSFGSAKGALAWTDPANKASATAMVYRDVSEAYWKVGDRRRATVVFQEGRAAGGDVYLYMGSAARAAAQTPAAVPSPGERSADALPPDAPKPSPLR